jgi:hypothetical protein
LKSGAVRDCGRCVEVCVEPVQRRAIGADFLRIAAHIEIDVRMVKWRIGADAHELFHADFDQAVAAVVLEVRNCVSGHGLPHSISSAPAYNKADARLSCAMRRF